MKLSFLCYLILFSLFNSETVLAQDSLKIEYSLNASGSFREGRLTQIRLPVNGSFTMIAPKWKAAVFANYQYQKTNGGVAENELFSKTFFSILPEKKVFPVIGYVFALSEFYQLKRRHEPGIGLGWRMVDKLENSLYFYGWIGYDNTEFKNISGYDTFRFNSVLNGRHELVEDKLTLQYWLYYFQSVEEANNYIWRIEPSLLFHLSKKLSMSINLESHFENIVDPSNTKRNSVLSFGLQFQNKA